MFLFSITVFELFSQVFDASDPHGGRKMRKSQRARLFAEWAVAKFGSGLCVLDVAGGTGALARALLAAGMSRVVLVDPRCLDHDISDPQILLQPRLLNSSFECPVAVDLVLALHPDEATDGSFEFAKARGIPFAVVPCCVFADSFVRNGCVRTYEDLLEYLQKKYDCERAYLQIQGRNIVLFGK